MNRKKSIFKLSRSQWMGIAVLASSVGLAAAVSIPNSFTTGTTISASQVNANFSALGTAVTAVESGLATAQTELNALRTQGGIVLAAAHVQGNTATPTINRSFSNLPGSPAVTVTRLGLGQFEVGFGASIVGRYFNAVQGNGSNGGPAGGAIDVTPRLGNANALFIRTFDLTGAAVDTNFYVQVF